MCCVNVAIKLQYIRKNIERNPYLYTYIYICWRDVKNTKIISEDWSGVFRVPTQVKVLEISRFVIFETKVLKRS